MYFQVIDNEENSRIDTNFMITLNGMDSFEDRIEIIETEVSLFFDNTKIYRVTSYQSDSQNKYFTIYVSNIAIIVPNTYKELINEGEAFLDSNGLKIVNLFYSFFNNLKEINEFSISRMQGMEEFYEIDSLSFRPELKFISNEERGSKELTIKKLPILKYHYENQDFEKVKNQIEIVCSFLSFCFGIRVGIQKLIYRTEDEIFVYRSTLPNNQVFVSNFFTVFRLLKENYNIQRILKTSWFNEYVKNEEKFNKAIDNYLHSREVNLSASFLLLFNIIEIFNIRPAIEKFEFNNKKEQKLSMAFKLISESLVNDEDVDLLRDKWNGLINNITVKPLKSPLEETLRLNNINPSNYGYSFNRLKKTRDKLTHGSVASITEKELKSQISCVRKISKSLILAKLGLNNDLKSSI